MKNLTKALIHGCYLLFIIRMGIIASGRLRSTAMLLGSVLVIGRCAGKPPGAERFQGIVEYEESALGFELPGRVLNLPVKVGDRVEPQQEIATLDPALEAFNAELRRAERRAAEAQVSLLRSGARGTDVRALASQLAGAREREATEARNVTRQRGLTETGAVGTAVLDEAEARLTAARTTRTSLESQLRGLRDGARSEELEIAQARADAAGVAVRAVDARLARHHLHAPSQGTVLGVHFELGEVVGAGMPVVTVADIAHPYIEVFVAEGRVSSLRIGQHARVTVDGAPHAFEGVIERIAQRTEFTPRFLFSDRERPNLVMRVRVRVQDPEGFLHAGVPAFATFEESTAQ